MTSTVRSADGRVVVPARLRRRRAEVQRGRGRKRLRRLVAFGILSAVAVAGWALLRSPLLAVDEIVIAGSDHVDREAVIEASGMSKGKAMMDVSPTGVAKKLEALPWIDSASVSREWPNRVEIRLADRIPVAQVETESGYVLVDAGGRVLESDVDRIDELPRLPGQPVGDPGSVLSGSEALLDTASSLPEVDRDRVVDIGFADDGSVALTLDGGGVVTLGRSEAYDAQFASLATMLDHLGGLAEGCTLDVSVPTAPTLTPEYGCA